MVVFRDIVNAQPLRAALQQRSENRRDVPKVSAWMTKQFHRWILNTFEHTVPLESPQIYQEVTGETIPDWLARKMAEGGPQPLALIVHDHPYLCELEGRCVEWLRSRSNTPLAQKFPRMTPDHVLAHWRTDHQRMQKIQQNGILQTSGGALDTILRFKGMRAVEFIPNHPEFRKELNNESVHMGHCLGQFEDRNTLKGGYGDHYADAAQEGHLRLFSLRNSQGAPHVTISVERAGEAWVIEQVKGKQNRPPLLKYAPPVKALLNKLDINVTPHRDCSMAGLFVQNGRFVSIEELEDPEAKLRAVAAFPALIGKVKHQTAAMKWMAISRSPSTASAITRPDPMMQTAAALLDPFSVDTLDTAPQVVDNMAEDRARGNIEDEPFRLRSFAAKGVL